MRNVCISMYLEGIRGIFTRIKKNNTRTITTSLPLHHFLARPTPLLFQSFNHYSFLYFILFLTLNTPPLLQAIPLPYRHSTTPPYWLFHPPPLLPASISVIVPTSRLLLFLSLAPPPPPPDKSPAWYGEQSVPHTGATGGLHASSLSLHIEREGGGRRPHQCPLFNWRHSPLHPTITVLLFPPSASIQPYPWSPSWLFFPSPSYLM